jgi:thiamine pyrophosphokinase
MIDHCPICNNVLKFDEKMKWVVCTDIKDQTHFIMDFREGFHAMISLSIDNLIAHFNVTNQFISIHTPRVVNNKFNAEISFSSVDELIGFVKNYRSSSIFI